VFCQIIAGKREAAFAWQDDVCVAFASIYPLQPGHLLLVPRRHVENLYGLPDDVGAHLLPVASRIGRAMKTALRADGLSVRQNNEKAGDQTVFHFHMHLIPRWEGKEVFKTLIDPPKATPEQLENAVAPVRKALAGG
jgi:histidine triad (HIT) family protein